MKRAQQVDTLCLLIAIDRNVPFNVDRQYDLSIQQSRKAIEMEPKFYLAHLTLAYAAAQKHDFSVAISEFKKPRSLEDNPWIIAGLVYAYAASRQKPDARPGNNALRKKSKHSRVQP